VQFGGYVEKEKGWGVGSLSGFGKQKGLVGGGEKGTRKQWLARAPVFEGRGKSFFLCLAVLANNEIRRVGCIMVGTVGRGRL